MTAQTILDSRRNDERRDRQGQPATVQQLLHDSSVILQACGVGMSASRLSRLVRRYIDEGIQSRGFAFVDYLLNTIQRAAEEVFMRAERKFRYWDQLMRSAA